MENVILEQNTRAERTSRLEQAKAEERIKRAEQKKRMEQKRRIEQEKLQDKKRKLIYMILVVLILIVIILLFLDIRNQVHDVAEALNQAGLSNEEQETFSAGGEPVQSSNEEIPSNYVELWGMTEVEKPVKRNHSQVLSRLSELSADNDIIGRIADNAQLYPENLLEALANNPEMADFVEKYPTTEQRATGGLTNQEKEQSYPLFLQWDPRWGYASYGDNSVVGLSGCGPVSLSMVLYYLTGDETLTPDYIAAYGMQNGYYMSGTGTKWALMNDIPALYNIQVSQPGISDEVMKKTLDQGKMIICAMGPGEFTAAGHFIVIYGYDENGFKINDPNCVARSRRSWPYEKFSSQIKSLWAFSAGNKNTDGSILTYDKKK